MDLWVARGSALAGVRPVTEGLAVSLVSLLAPGTIGGSEGVFCGPRPSLESKLPGSGPSPRGAKSPPRTDLAPPPTLAKMAKC